MNQIWKIGGGLALVVTLLIGALVFSGQVFAESEGKSDASSDDDGQLVVSVEGNADKQSIKSTDEDLFGSPQMKKEGFQAVDSLLDGKKDTVQAMDQDFRKSVVNHMGLVYLIEYSESQYQDAEAAKSQLEKTLESMGMDVRYVQDNYTMHAFGEATEEVEPMDIHPEQEWNYNMMNVPEAWNTTPGSSSTTVAVLDTGIDSSHQNLSDYVDTQAGESFVGGDTEDGQGHGTHVAGTISSYGNVAGVMQEATLIPVKVLDDRGTGSMYDIQEGITHAANENADVINMSLGGGRYDQGMDETIDMATSEGTIVVAASGNEGASRVSYPAAYDGAIAVGSVNSRETRSDFSNYGPELDVVAPGEGIFSTVPGNGYDTLSGTSMASPHVAGEMGLIRSADPDISVNEARNVLTNTAQDAGSENEYGHGIADAEAAVQQAGDGGGGEDPGEPGDPGNPDPAVPEWEAYTFYAYGDVVSYDGQEYVSLYSHYSSPGLEPPYTPIYWAEY